MRATRTKIALLSTTRCAFTNGRFWSQARPHKGFRRRRSSATLRTETRGERRIGPKDAIYGWTLTIGMLRPFYLQLANVYDLARIAISSAPQNPVSPHKKWHLGIEDPAAICRGSSTVRNILILYTLANPAAREALPSGRTRGECARLIGSIHDVPRFRSCKGPQDFTSSTF